jgi:hypothetical protein
MRTSGDEKGMGCTRTRTEVMRAKPTGPLTTTSLRVRRGLVKQPLIQEEGPNSTAHLDKHVWRREMKDAIILQPVQFAEQKIYSIPFTPILRPRVRGRRYAVLFSGMLEPG